MKYQPPFQGIKMQLIFSNKYKLWGRLNTCDELVMGEIERSYHRLNLKPGDVVLDVGANIGAFSVYAAKKGCQVYAFEPDAENYEVLLENTKSYTSIVPFREALVGTHEKEIEFFTNDSGRNKGLHSLVVQRGRGSHTVPANNFSDVVSQLLPNKIKMDTEGGEVSMLLGRPIHSCVKAIALEIHLQRKEWRYDQMPRLIKELHQQFPICVVKPTIDEKNRATLGVFHRE